MSRISRSTSLEKSCSALQKTVESMRNRQRNYSKNLPELAEKVKKIAQPIFSLLQ